MHLDGIHSKLIGITKERSLVGIGQLREEAEKSRAVRELDSCPPSQATQQIAKQLRILTQVLTPVLHEEQMAEICTKAAEIFSEELASASLEVIHEFGICQDDVQNHRADETADRRKRSFQPIAVFCWRFLQSSPSERSSKK